MITKIVALMLTICGLYTQKGIVTEIHRPKDTVRVVTTDGNIWEFYGIEDYEVCDTVELIMSDMGTNNPEDDVILRARYRR